MKSLIKMIVVGFILFLVTPQAWSKELGDSPTEITMEVEINAPIEKVWQEFSQIGNIYLNSPTVTNSYLSSDKKYGIGATRHMEMAIAEGATLDERVIEWDEGTYMALEVYQIKNVTGVKTMGGDFRLIPKGNQTILRSTLNYSMSNAFFGVMNELMMKNEFKKLWSSILAGYKKHIETDEHITMRSQLDTENVRLISVKAVN